MVNYLAKYAFYKKKSGKGLQIEFIIDQMPYSPRRSAAENQWKVICERSLTKYEKFEMDTNKPNRRFLVWHYEDIDTLIEDDKKYGVETPKKFIEECKKRGYVKKNKQLRLFNEV